MAPPEERHFGKWLRSRIERLGVQKQSAAERIGVEPVTLRSWFNKPSPGIRMDNRVNLAKLLGITVEQISERLEKGRQLEAEQAAFEKGMGTAAKILEKGREISNVQGFSESEVPGEIPLFEMSVAAGPWTDVTDVAEVWEPGQIDHGFFRVRIAGDSMEPRFPDQSVVEFKCLRQGRDQLLVGRNYYVQLADGLATFKTLEEAEDERYVLRAINKKKYPKPMPVLRRDVVRMALAVAIVTLV